MDCRVLREITLKSNGCLACEDSLGYGIELGQVSRSPAWQLKEVLNGPKYRHVRSSFQAGKVPWPDICEQCDFFSGGSSPLDTLDHRMEILVEPTLDCNLTCPCCLRRQILSTGRTTDPLDPAIFRHLLESAYSDGITVDQIHYIGWGEPLQHGDFRALFDIAKSTFPLANQLVTTAGNVDFRSSVGNIELDRIIVSCDGVNQRSYSRYRRGGDFETVLRFMRDSKKLGSPNTFLEWKYILFEFNDSDQEIIQAQRLAEDIGVDSLMFVLTNSKWHSKRFTVENTQTLPLTSAIATVSPAAAMNAVAVDGSSFDESAIIQRGFGHIDICAVSVGKFLTVEGWALDRDGAYAEMVELIIDGQSYGKSRTKLRRQDVQQAHAEAQGPNCGFMFRIPINPQQLPCHIEVVIRGSSEPSSLGGKPLWALNHGRLKRRFDLPTV